MKALLEVWAESVRALADTPLLPLTNWLDYNLYPRLLNKEFSVLSGEENPEVSQFYKDNNIEISNLNSSYLIAHLIVHVKLFIRSIRRQN